MSLRIFSWHSIASAVTVNTVGDFEELRELKRVMTRYPLEIIFPLAARFDYLAEGAVDDLFAHLRACERGEPSYRTESSKWSILTATHLENRGNCCLSGCRHCPFGEGPRLGGKWKTLCDKDLGALADQE